MAITFLCKFLSANLQGDGSYILSSSDDEVPNGFDWETGDADNAVNTPGSPWPVGEPVLDHTAAASILSSTDSGLPTAFPQNAMRLLFTFEMDASPGGNYNFIRWDTASSDNLEIEWINATPAIRVSRNSGGGSGLHQWTSGTLAVGTAYALEIRVDTSEGVDANVLQCRVWAIGGSPGSLLQSSPAGSGFTSAAFNLLTQSIASGNFIKVGRYIADDDTAADLSAYDEDYPGGVEPSASELVQPLPQRNYRKSGRFL